MPCLVGEGEGDKGDKESECALAARVTFQHLCKTSSTFFSISTCKMSYH